MDNNNDVQSAYHQVLAKEYVDLTSETDSNVINHEQVGMPITIDSSSSSFSSSSSWQVAIHILMKTEKTKAE